MTAAELAARLRRAGFVVYRRPCSNPAIRKAGLVTEVTCGCGYTGFNAFGMPEEYERHKARAELDAAGRGKQNADKETP